jgi:hypothetical protein
VWKRRGNALRGLRRGPREILFSLDAVAGEAYITLYVGGQEVASIGRLRRLETLRVIRRDGYEGLELRFIDARFDPVTLETKPGSSLSWDVMSLGTW